MAKTPDEIKKGLVCCNGDDVGVRCGECPYGGDGFDCICMLTADILALIRQLEAERDAAVKDCSRFMCETCAEKDNGDNCSWCAVVNGCRNGYVWRGVQKEVQP